MAGELFIQKYPNNQRTISGLNNDVFQDDSVLLCDTSIGPVDIILDEIPTNYWSTQWKLYIVDSSNNASVNNITINCPSGFLINGQPSFVISVNKASLLIRISSNTDFIGQYSSSSTPVISLNKISLPYVDLVNLINTNTLEAGKYYEVNDYQTIHRIPTSSNIHTGPIEPVMVLALSTNKVSTTAWSEQYPFDLLEYDYANNLVEDGVTPRNGKITYRKDTIKNLETYYDFRNVVFYRYAVDKSLMATWISGNYYNAGTFLVEAGIIYYCREGHVAGVSFANDLSSIYWVRIMDGLVGTYGFKILTRDVQNMFEGLIYGKTQTEVYTFSNVDARNVSIGKVTSNANFGYNNVVVLCESGAVPIFNDITVGGNTIDCTIFGDAGNYYSINNIKIGSDCSRIYTNAQGLEISDKSIDVLVNGRSQKVSIGEGNSSVYIGDNCDNVYIQNGNQLLFLDKGCHSVTIGNETLSNYILRDSIFVEIGNGCFNNVLYTSSYNTLHNRCGGIFLLYAQGNTFNELCIDIKNASGIYNYGQFEFNEFGSGCFDIICYGQLKNSKFGMKSNNIDIQSLGVVNNSQFGNDCSLIVISKDFLYSSVSNKCSSLFFIDFFNYSSIGSGCSNVTFSRAVLSSTFGNSIKDCVFSLVTNSSIANDTQQHTFNNNLQNTTFAISSNVIPKIIASSIDYKTISAIDVNGDYWYINVDTLGVMTTTKVI